MPALAAAAIASAVIGAGTSIYQGKQAEKSAKSSAAARSKAGAQAASRMAKEAQKIKWRDVAPPERVDPFAIADRAYQTNLTRALEVVRKGDELGRARTQEFGARLEELVPGAKGLISASMKNISQQMAGELPSDVRRQIASAATAQGSRGGRSTAARNLSLASLGLSSLEGQRYANDQALKLMQPFMQVSQDLSALSPAMMQYTLMTPGQFYDAANQQAMQQYTARYNNQLQRLNAAVSRFNAVQNTQQTALGNTVGALSTALAGDVGMANAWGAAGQQITSALGFWAGNRPLNNTATTGGGGGGMSAGGRMGYYAPAPYPTPPGK